MASRLVLVDGSAMIFRAYYAIPGNLCTAGGLHTNAIYGFATMFRKLFAGRRPDLGAVIFDAPGKTFRDEAYEDYKADRVQMQDDLSEQLPWIDRLVHTYRFPLLKVPGYEADDVIGTLAERAAGRDIDTLIVSGDKDFSQLIGPRVRMLDPMRDITYDEALVKKKWGVPPSQFVDLLALMGDKIDNIPGVPGIGQKGAAQLLEAYGDLNGILEHLEALKPRHKKALEAHREDALMSRQLASIVRDVPLEVELDGLALEAPDPEALNTLFRELEFYSLLSDDAAAVADAELEGPAVEVLREPEAVAALLDGDGPVAVESIHEGPDPRTGALVGLAIQVGARVAWVPWTQSASEPLGEVLTDAGRPKVTHDAKALWLALRGQGLELDGVTGDTRLASFLVEPTKLIPHQLEQLVKEYLHRSLVPEKRLLGGGKSARTFSELPDAEAAAWAGARVRAVAELWPMLEAAMREAGQAAQHRDLELPLTFVLGRMQLVGIGVDVEDLGRLGEELAGRLTEYEEKIYAAAGRRFNVASTKQLSEVLFEEMKLPVIKRTKTGYSTASEVLERLAPKHEIARDLLEHRKLSKLISTYTNVLKDAVDPETSRIHATFQQTVGATGRLISTDPDLQRTPIRTDEGKRIRRAFVAPPGKKLISADWSQIELRILAHVSKDPRLQDAFQKARDVHAQTAAELFSVAVDEVTAEQRGVGKTVNFATIYGQGSTALGHILGVPKKEAQAYIDGYFEVYAGVRAWLDETIAAALERGWVETLFGRRRYIPELSSNGFMERAAGERIAANTPIQGSAADLCKLAMLRIHESLRAEALESEMVLQIHDELVFEAPEPEVDRVAALARHHMESVYPLDVPLVVDVGVGQSWGEAH